MSCFVMEPRAIAALARGMETILNIGYTFAGFTAPTTLAVALLPCRDKYDFYDEKQIFKMLYDLNEAAYAGRYKEEPSPAPDWPEDVPRLLTRPTYNGYYKPNENFWKYYKLLDCLVYQTSEDATRDNALYLALLDFSRVLAAYLVRNCAAYNAAEWGRV